MTYPVFAASLGAFLIIIQQILLMNVGSYRTKVGIGSGTGGDLQLERKMRQHGNLAENAAIFIVMLAFVEMLGASILIVQIFAAVFLAARLLHFIAFASLAGSHDPGGIFLVLRGLGAFGTVLSGVGVGVYLLYLIYA